ncbi:hypothetical protein EUGRSUZ_J01860 [Eucalyptus grandis]|uniref:Uncharacterized protein n=2 Tax=Eucalyptus grandis TaxID=71139 RepID=A0A059AEK8_EUCGR|nr:hypothetical protein EUGRSUZ_J01860 [Eucalyptus grandis]
MAHMHRWFTHLIAVWSFKNLNKNFITVLGYPSRFRHVCRSRSFLWSLCFMVAVIWRWRLHRWWRHRIAPVVRRRPVQRRPAAHGRRRHMRTPEFWISMKLARPSHRMTDSGSRPARARMGRIGMRCPSSVGPAVSSLLPFSRPAQVVHFDLFERLYIARDSQQAITYVNAYGLHSCQSKTKTQSAQRCIINMPRSPHGQKLHALHSEPLTYAREKKTEERTCGHAIEATHHRLAPRSSWPSSGMNCNNRFSLSWCLSAATC